MPSTEHKPSLAAAYSPEHRQILLRLAWDSIRHGLAQGSPLPVQTADYPSPLQAPHACFVTLQKQGRLRGCIGHLEAVRPLIEDVAGNAYAAAFQDPRFPPVQTRELEQITLEISVLSEAEPLRFDDREGLLQKIRPGIDGLILSSPDGHRGTFLPSVWEALPSAEQFLRQLVIKAGLPPGYWSNDLQLARYTSESFG